jgi:2-polyprenyl-3-methyl-5-hydroxy-6-metoxy-1,4-benzoquinol methylase
MWDVLEHVTDPVKFLGLCVTFLKPSGILIVNVPDISSFQAWVLGEHWPLLLPEHLNYFDRNSALIRVLERKLSGRTDLRL